MKEEKLRELLVRPGYVRGDDFDFAVNLAKQEKREIDEVLVERNLIQDDQLGKLIAEELGFPFVQLSATGIDDAVFDIVPELVARSKGVAAFAKGADGIRLAMLNPNDRETIHRIAKRTGLQAIPHLITKRNFNLLLAKYRGDITETFGKILHNLEDPLLIEEQRDGIIVQIVDTVIQYGHDSGASDIHLEPHTDEVLVRFRIDGVMHDVLKLPKKLLRHVVTRIKVMSKMRTDEHQSAQDGKIRFGAVHGNIDIRVSVLPVTEGENVVMRLLSASIRGFTLGNLGMSSPDLEKLDRAIQIPHGMILVAGPTGSGKTTTVYAILKVLNTREVHIASIEDPVEYDIEGVSQIQVNPKTNLTFADGLRAIVRQDPDVIFVGEIRDKETADIAVNSAMTGHLVLSTLHADDAATTPVRLMDMDIEPFLVSSTINVVVAQRLLRRICTVCRFSYKLSDAAFKEEREIIEHHPHIKQLLKKSGHKDIARMRLYRGKGCSACGNTGYHGRIGIFEILEMTDEIKELIMNRSSHDELMKAAYAQGMISMMEDGIAKMVQGITTLEEVLRLARE